MMIALTRTFGFQKSWYLTNVLSGIPGHRHSRTRLLPTLVRAAVAVYLGLLGLGAPAKSCDRRWVVRTLPDPEIKLNRQKFTVLPATDEQRHNRGAVTCMRALSWPHSRQDRGMAQIHACWCRHHSYNAVELLFDDREFGNGASHSVGHSADPQVQGILARSSSGRHQHYLAQV